MPFIPDTVEEPAAAMGRFIPDAPSGDEDPLTPAEQSDAEHLSDIAAAGKLTRPERLSGNVASFLDATETLTASLHRPIAQVRKGVAGIATNLGFFTPDEFQEKVESIDHPVPLIPSVPAQEGQVAQVGAGVANGIIDFVNGMADPDAAMQLGVAGVPSAGRKALLTLFAVSMAKEAPDQFESGVEAVRRGDTQEAARHFTGGAGSTILPILMAKHANTPAQPSLPDRAAKSEMLAKALDASDLKVPSETGTVPIPREAGPLRPGEEFKSELPNVSPELQALAPQTAAVVTRSTELPKVEAQLESPTPAIKGDLSEPEVKATQIPLIQTPRVSRGVTGKSRLNAETERTGPDILDFLANEMPIFSRSSARKSWGKEKYEANKSLWDDAPTNLSAIHHNAIYGRKGTGTTGPDVAAQSAFERGLIDEPSVNALWQAIRDASRKRTSADPAKVETAFAEQQAKEHIAWTEATKTGNIEVTTEDLAPGDLLEVGGERVKVIARDEQTGDLTLEDGTTFGRQTLPEGEKLYVEKLEQKGQPSTEFLPLEPKPDLALEQPESIEQQNARLAAEKAKAQEAAAKEKMARETAAPLQGTTGDLGQGDLLGGPTDLFAPPTPNNKGLVGMGAAVPGEFAKPGTHVSNMFAAIEADRAAMGKEPMPETKTRTWDEDNTRALARMNRDPGWIPNLIAEVSANPRPLLSWENAGLVWQRHAWKAEANNALARIARAFEDGRPEDLEAAKLDAARFETNLEELDRAVGRNGTGSEAGRSLAAQKMAAGEDFTLIEMRLNARAEKGGEPLTDVESKELADLHAKLDAADKAATEAAAAAQTRIVTLEIEKALAEARAAAAPSYPPSVLAHAEKFVQFMHKQGDAARVRLKERLGRTSAGIDPTILSDVAIIGAEHLSSKALDLAKWTDVMVRDVGEWIREHAQEAYDASKTLLTKNEDEFFKGTDKSTKEKVTRKLTENPAARQSITDGLKEAVEDGSGPADIGRYARKLAETFISDGIRDLEPLTDAVHGVLKEIIPEITRTESRDAWTQYGKYKLLDKEPVKVRLRELSTEGQKISTIERLEKGLSGLKTGSERQPPTDAARRLQKKINELKKELGLVTTDPATQLRSALDAIHTRNKNRIADLRFENSTRTRIVRDKKAAPADAESIAQRAEIEKLKKENEEIFGGKELSDEQRLQRAISASERAETAAEAQLTRAEKGDFGAPPGKPQPSSIRLDEIRARTAALRQQTAHLRDLANPKKTPEQIALQSLKTRLATEKAGLQDRIAKGDFSPRRKNREMPLDTETAAAKAEVAALRNQFGKLLARNRYEKKSRLEKIWIGIKEARGAAVNIASSFDFSAPRQALLAILGNTSRLVTNPVRGAGMLARPFGKMFSAWSSERMAGIIEQKIKDRPNAKSGADKMAGIEYTELTSDTFSRYEENAHSILDEWAALPFKTGKLTKTIVTAPVKAASRGVRMSNRAFITFLNSTRAELFDELLRVNFKDSAPTELQLKIVGNMVNVSTGRGKLGPKTSSVASEVLWAPKLLASRVQFLTGQPLLSGNLKGSGKARAIVAKEYARIIASGFLLYQVSRLFDDKKEESLTSSDVGKIVRGDTRIDLWGGLQQVTVLGARTATSETTTLKGKTKDIGAARKYGQRGIWYTWMDFGRSKLRPDVAAAVDIITRSDFKGDPTTPGGVAQSLLVPLPMRSVTEIMKAHGFTEAMIIEALGQFGAGVSHYEGKEAQR